MTQTPDTNLVDARGRKYLTPEERTRFLAAIRAHAKPTVQTLARTLAMTGCRVSEALAIRAYDVDLEAVEIRISTLKRRREHWRAVPVPQDLSSTSSTWSTASDARPGKPSRANRPAVGGDPPDREPPGARADAQRRHHRSPSGHFIWINTCPCHTLQKLVFASSVKSTRHSCPITVPG